MKKNPRCKCNFHCPETLKVMAKRKHRDCRTCARDLIREAKAMKAMERKLFGTKAKKPYSVEYGFTRTSLVDLLMAADTLIHYLEAERVVFKGPKGVKYKDYEKALNTLLKIAGTKRALGIIKASKD